MSTGTLRVPAKSLLWKIHVDIYATYLLSKGLLWALLRKTVSLNYCSINNQVLPGSLEALYFMPRWHLPFIIAWKWQRISTTISTVNLCLLSFLLHFELQSYLFLIYTERTKSRNDEDRPQQGDSDIWCLLFCYPLLHF